MRHKLLNEQARFVLYDNGKIRLPRKGESFAEVTEVCVSEGWVNMEQVGAIFVEKNKDIDSNYLLGSQRMRYDMERLSVSIGTAKEESSIIYDQILELYHTREYFGIHIEKSYWPELTPIG